MVLDTTSSQVSLFSFNSSPTSFFQFLVSIRSLPILVVYYNIILIFYWSTTEHSPTTLIDSSIASPFLLLMWGLEVTPMLLARVCRGCRQQTNRTSKIFFWCSWVEAFIILVSVITTIYQCALKITSKSGTFSKSFGTGSFTTCSNVISLVPHFLPPSYPASYPHR